MKNIKVCILTSVHPAFDTRIFHKEAKTLSQAGYEVVLIAPHVTEDTVDGIKIIPLPKPKNRLARMLVSTWRILVLAIKQKGEVYHFHDPELIPAGICLRLLGKKVIYDAHENVPEQILSKIYLPLFMKYPISRIVRWIEDISAKIFDFTITATVPIENRFRKSTNKVIAIHNFPILSDFYSLDDNRAKKRKTNNSLNLIFLGEIYEERGLSEAIKAMNLLPQMEIRFLLYGVGEKYFLEKLRKLDKYNRLEYRGFIPYIQIKDALSEADIGYICDYPLKRHMEGLPVKLFEFMAFGLPVIAANFPAWGEIIKKNNSGIMVNPLSPEEIAGAIKYFSEFPETRVMMGRNGRDTIRQYYSWEEEGKKMLDVYTKILQG